ncbi:hypothetical protein EV138_1358 [Kribbella voronezhensis]|uniref:Uncharacterized protein n=1 Tax=Kribbella voronezhensis TaxID=2512212 RepID=A0A4R7T9C5_9ACTN|nr:hypothetical protein [Kribbella voronezhensis]TDU87828.1 hypothetical protein EV138_1358 [Kribbella voronezhensis]
MKLAGALIRLYPKSFRDRWEDELRLEAHAAGARGLPDLAAGAVSQWLHPALWPATRPDQRYGRATASLTAVTLGTWLLAYLTGEQDKTAIPHGLDAAAYLMVFAIVLSSPWPKLTGAALTTLARRGLARLALPLLVGAAVVVIAKTTAGPVTYPARQLLPAMWWASLLAFAVQAPRVITDVCEHAARPAGPARLRTSIDLVTAANLAIAATILARAASSRHFLPAATAVMIAVLTIPALFTRRDLSSLRGSIR